MLEPTAPLAFGVFDHLDCGERPLTTVYEQRLQIAEAYDRWGFYSYHLAEHHFTPLGGAPSPNVFLSALSQRTRTLRLGALVYLFPFYHPLRLAEEICMLDQLSNGRLDIGLGRGISPLESRLFGNEPDGAQALFDEAAQIVMTALTTGTVTHHGPAFDFDDVAMTLQPVQRPHPPLWYGTGSVESAERCARAGYNVITSEPSSGREVLSRFFAERERCGGPALKGGIARFIVVAETDAEARAIGDAAYPEWHRSFNSLYRKHGRGPVKGERPPEFSGALAAGKAIAGTPETVTRILREQLDEIPANYVVGQFVFGNMPLQAALRSVNLFGSRVIPALREARVAV